MVIDFPTHAFSSWSKPELAELERFQAAAAGCLVDTRWDTAQCDDGEHYAALLVEAPHLSADAPLATITKGHDGYALFLGAGQTVATGRTLVELTDAFLADRAK